MPAEGGFDCGGDLGVAAVMAWCKLHVEFDRDRLDTFDPLHRSLNRRLLGISIDMAAECDDAVLDADADIRRIDGAVPVEFGFDIGLHLHIGFHCWLLQG